MSMSGQNQNKNRQSASLSHEKCIVAICRSLTVFLFAVTVAESVVGPLRPFGDIGPVGHILLDRQSVPHLFLGTGDASQ